MIRTVQGYKVPQYSCIMISQTGYMSPAVTSGYRSGVSDASGLLGCYVVLTGTATDGS
jgi:hypothetical protein